MTEQKPVKILIVASWYPSPDHPVSNIFVHEQAAALVRAGYDVAVINTEIVSFKSKAHWGKSFREADGVKIFQLTVPVYGRGKAKPYIDVTNRAMRYLYGKASKSWGKPDIIHIHSSRFAGPIGVKLAKEHSIPCVLTEHLSKIIHKTMNEDEKKCLTKAIRGAGKVIAVSPSLAEELKNFGCENPIYIPNVVDGRLFNYAPKSHGDFTFISTAWLSKRKGMDILIRAFGKLKNKHPYLKLKICGSGAELDALKNLAAQLELADSVEFTGERDRAQLCQELNSSDCFVLASYAETFGVVYIEALACGLPVIATRCGGPEGIVNDTNGILVDTGDVDALCAAMEKIYSERDSYSGAALRKGCLDLYGCEVVVSQLSDVYNSLLDI
ncbi:MAG: glycosyltransferase [Clostridia bacterium]|nr:glycosyltransferase [Clostridia bacterium]